ncbi:MAG: YkgJ family cysteine cluster protein [Pyrinomonadaceae bacterium]
MNHLVQITRYPRSEYNDLISEMNTAHRSRLLKEQMPLADTSPYRNTSVSARSREKPPECVTCGVCCSLPLIVTVPRGDEKRLKEYWDITVDEVVVERVIGRDLQTGRCINLEGTLGESIGCRIYEDRPNICRAFDAGSDRCLEYRRMYGIDPQLTASELARDLAMLPRAKGSCITDAEIDLNTIRTSMHMAKDGSGEMIFESTKVMKVTVGFDRGESEPIELFQFEAGKDEWFESEFLGLTLDEARQMIAARASEKTEPQG